jgi:hypothetical protein
MMGATRRLLLVQPSNGVALHFSSSERGATKVVAPIPGIIVTQMVKNFLKKIQFN